MAAILKVGRQLRNPTPSIDGHLLEEQHCQISYLSDLNDGALGFKERRFNKNKNNNNNNNNKKKHRLI